MRAAVVVTRGRSLRSHQGSKLEVTWVTSALDSYKDMPWHSQHLFHPKKGTSQPPGNPAPALRLEARTRLLGAMSIGYAHGFPGHNLGPGVVDLGAGLVDPGSVQ